jgi:pseudaminic acid cytidylyltransferase
VNIAIIPARGGSKRIPRKNIKVFGGKPMIAYAITAAKNSGLFEHVVVSTDDAEIATIANEWGAETPFVRPAELANDFTATVPVVAQAIQACEELGWVFDNVCCIYPGVPFIEIEDLQGAFKHLEVGLADYCFPVTEFPSAIQRALKRNSDWVVQPFYPELQLTRTQDLEPAYFDAGQFYWGNKRAWLSNPRIHCSGIGYQIPSWRVVDIDTPEDCERAELLAMAIKSR